MKPRTVAAARDHVLALLKIRIRSEKEIRDRLKRKDFPAEVIQETVALFKRAGAIDDELFARLWVSSRIKKPLGVRRLRYELHLKGVDKRVIDEAIEKAAQEYPQDEAVAALVRLKMKSLKGLTPEKIKARIYSFLARRGFSPDVIREALDSSLRNREELPLD